MKLSRGGTPVECAIAHGRSLASCCLSQVVCICNQDFSYLQHAPCSDVCVDAGADGAPTSHHILLFALQSSFPGA